MLTALLIIVAIIAALLIYGALQPQDFSVSRAADFSATPSKVFENINDFQKWSAWSPWEKMDPNLQRSFSGTTSGAGAKYAWVGNKKVGEGSMEITQSEPSKRMQLDLHFLKPFKADNVTEFTLMPKGNQTKVLWEMRGKKPFVMRVMGIFFNMDKIVGADFEKGLANLKTVVES